MQFYSKEFKKIRKAQKLSMKDVAERMGLGWQTIWAWENEKRIPSEAKLRSLSNAIDCNVEDISDLKPEAVKSEGGFQEVANSWFSFLDGRGEEHLKECNYFIAKIKKQSEELIKAEVVIKALLSSINAMIYIKDAELNYIIANDTFLKNIKLPKSFDVKGKMDADLFSKSDASINSKEDVYVVYSGQPIINRENIIPGSKKKKWGMTSKIPIFDKNNKVAGLVGVFFDISVRAREERIRKVLESCIENTYDGIALFSYDDNNYIYYNKALENIFGIKARNNYPLNFYHEKILCPEFLDIEKRTIDPNDDTPHIENILKIKKLNSDEYRWIQKSTSKFKIQRSKYRLAIIKDITEAIESKKRQELLELCINILKDGVTILDLETNENIYLNEAAGKLSGYPIEVFLKKDGGDFWLTKVVHPDYRKYIEENRQQCYKIYKIIKSNGEHCWIESTTSFKKFHGRKCAIVIERDITEKKNKNNEVSDAVEKQTINIAKNLLIQGVDFSIISKSTGLKVEYIKDLSRQC